ncbi:glutaredoxin family protein [Microbacterium amylolyticum]|uniref:Glutaredoxin-like protein NrdH n=2 Tax=Microbacterium amylolyticum TaxID=936337 RepID=A0ABS4ZLH8_9MICO|nr:glutaredoxin family protein [Microbacterium amylolyticum]MBP2437868.1 glutaredoxin-like protein NrdH [Microbacterium amylolyticum]
MNTVTVYSTGPSCIRCTMTKRVLADKGIPFNEIDIRDDANAREYVTQDLGYTEAPVCVVEDGTDQDHWSGFRPDHIDRIAALT